MKEFLVKDLRKAGVYIPKTFKDTDVIPEDDLEIKPIVNQPDLYSLSVKLSVKLKTLTIEHPS